jgi:hypothetical protein
MEDLKGVDSNIFYFIIILNNKWCGDVCKCGHFGASRLQGSRRIEYKGCVGEMKEIDPGNSLYLSLIDAGASLHISQPASQARRARAVKAEERHSLI